MITRIKDFFTKKKPTIAFMNFPENANISIIIHTSGGSGGGGSGIATTVRESSASVGNSGEGGCTGGNVEYY